MLLQTHYNARWHFCFQAAALPLKQKKSALTKYERKRKIAQQSQNEDTNNKNKNKTICTKDIKDTIKES